MKAYQYNFTDELIVDNFAGGGGASTGIELATGRIVDIAVNHDRAAIEMHEKNHPYTRHFCEDVWEIDPRKVTQGRPVALVWCSPDCKHFSKAKGGTPVSKKIRGLAWVAVRWAATVRPRVIILENVEEFMTWGPIKDGQPIKEKAGQTFRSFVNELKKLGYAVDWRVMRACDYGAPTSRKRFFLIARCDGQPIIFPEPTHGDKKPLKPYKTAAECIDWRIPCKTIFGRNKPLSVNTLKRIARGLDKFVIRSPRPFIMQMNYENAPQSVDDPLSTITAVNKHFAVDPVLTPYVMSNNTGNAPHGANEPLPTITTGNRNFVVSPYLSKYYGGEKQAGADVGKPLPTITAIDHNALAAVSLTSRYGNGEDGRGREIDKPLPTVTAGDHNQLLGATLVKYYTGEDNVQDVAQPLHTVTTEPRFALLASHIATFRRGMDGQSVGEPLSTITAKAGHHAEVRTYLTKLGSGDALLGKWNEVRELLNAYAGYKIAADEILIIEIDGVQYFISDVAMRMLEPHELAAAQGFPPDYVLKVSDSYSKSAQIARIGNSVCPVMATVLVRANLPELCVRKKLKTMKELEKVLTA